MAKANSKEQFSRRHLTAEANAKARAAYRAKQKAKIANAKARVEAAKQRSSEEQLARLNAAGHRAVKERARLEGGFTAMELIVVIAFILFWVAVIGGAIFLIAHCNLFSF